MAELNTLATLLADAAAYYPFNSGALTTDSSGNSNTLTNNNSVGEEANGKYGYAADFSSSNTNKSLSYAGAIGSGAVQTLAFWVKFHAEISTGSEEMFYFAFNGNNTQSLLVYEYNSGTRRLGAGRHIPGVAIDYSYSNQTLGTDWHHVVFERNNTAATSKVWLDTSLIINASLSTSGTGTTDFINFGTGWNSTYSSFIVDDLSIFKKALTPAEILELYEDQATNKTRMFLSF